ncbi:unnamed protein product [Penicillium glandicola]
MMRGDYGQGAAKRTVSQAGFNDEVNSDDDLPTYLSSRPRHISPNRSSARTPPQDVSERFSDQELIAKSKEAEERGDLGEAKSLLLRISDKTVFEPLFEELDTARKRQIQINKDFEREAKEAELQGDWQTANSLLSRVVGEDEHGHFLLLTLEYSRSRLEWEFDTKDLMEHLRKKYPDPRLVQV